MRASVLCSIVIASSTLAAQTVQYPEPRFTDPNRGAILARAYANIPARMERLRDELHAPGLSWGIVVDGALAASGGVGVARTPDGPAVDSDTVFRIASMTKSFTALAILKLRDEGRLSLDDAAGKYVPELAHMPLPTSDAPAITVRHLLTHSAGFPEDNPWGDRQLAQPTATLHSWVATGLPFSTSPATAYEYSNYGFALLGQIVAKASGMPYREYVTAKILIPLGMRSTYWDERDVPPARLAHGYRYVDGKWQDEPLLADGAFGAMGGLFTSGRDLARYVAFMLSAWPPRDAEDTGPVRRSSLREMQQGQRLIGFTATRPAPDAPLAATLSAYGYGLTESRDCRSRVTVAHGGGLPGFGSVMMWLPEHGMGVYAMANVTYAGARSAGRAVLDELSATGGLTAREVPASRPLVDARETVTALVNKWHDETLTKVAADNLLLDRSLDDRRAEVQRLHDAVGACRPDGNIRPENWLRGTFRLACERGWVDVTVTLAPTGPPAIQYLAFDEGRAMEPSLRKAIESTIGPAADTTVATVLAPSVDRDALSQQLAALRSSYGSCTLGDTLGGDGRTEARVSLECERGPIDLIVHADADGRLDRVRFVQPRDTPCVP
jgi:CubicO group peptidase (beta-lactamase class C family)